MIRHRRPVRKVIIIQLSHNKNWYFVDPRLTSIDQKVKQIKEFSKQLRNSAKQRNQSAACEESLDPFCLQLLVFSYVIIDFCIFCSFFLFRFFSENSNNKNGFRKRLLIRAIFVDRSKSKYAKGCHKAKRYVGREHTFLTSRSTKLSAYNIFYEENMGKET